MLTNKDVQCIREVSWNYYIRSGEALRREDACGAQLYISISDNLYEMFVKACGDKPACREGDTF
jgi:hypothetical protein